MFSKNLNKTLNYTLRGKTYSPSTSEIRLIYTHLIDKTYWGKQGKYSDYKSKLKKSHYYSQGGRCSYCRVKLRTEAYWEDLDHVVAQTNNEKWLFYPKNLIVTCIPCNRLKSKKSTLSNPSSIYFPLFSKGFTIFNPHFDEWSDHFEIINDLFLRGKPGTKGPQTYEHCQLFRHDIIISYVDEKRIWGIFTMRRLTHMLSKTLKGSREEMHINNAINHLITLKGKKTK